MTTLQVSYLSERANRFPVDLHYINNYSTIPALENPFEELKNPTGIINFGTAVSGLMDDVWMTRFSTKSFFNPNPSHYRYYTFWGPSSFRKVLAEFMTTFFKPHGGLICAENLFVLNGALLALDILGLLLADEGECFLFLAPGYSGYLQAASQRWKVNMIPVPLQYNEDSRDLFDFSIDSLEKIISDEVEKGRRVRAIVFNNPHNPLGKVFSKDVVQDVMRMCQRRKIHLIADEMYCMSVFDKNVTFCSVLEVHRPELLDPNLLHVIWGFSKDLCLTSFRTGVIHTKNQALQNALISGSQFQAVPLPMMDILKNVINDIDWFKHTFLPTHHSRLQQAYEKSKDYFRKLGFTTTETHAGVFFLVDFRPLFNPPGPDTSKAFIKKLYEYGVYMTPSWDMGAEDGWFRFVFSAYMGQGLEIGLQRLHTAIQEWKQQGTVFT